MPAEALTTELAGKAGDGAWTLKALDFSAGGGTINSWTLNFSCSAPPDEIPTLSEWGLISLTLFLLAVGWMTLSKRMNAP